MENTKKDSEKIFEKLAEETKRLSRIEKIAIIAEVKIDKKPLFHHADMHGNGFYMLDGKPMDWTSYALAKIKDVERNKNQALYQ
jgi:hypothetical protein